MNGVDVNLPRMKFLFFLVSVVLGYAPVAGRAAPFSPKVAVQTYSFRDLTLDEALAKIHAARISRVECYIGQEIGDGSEEKISPVMSKEAAAKVARLLEKYGIRMVSLGVCVQESGDDIAANCRLAAGLGAEYINIEVFPETIPLYSQAAAKCGLKVAVHNHAGDSRKPYENPATVLAAIRGLENVGVCPDIGHYARAGGDVLANLKALRGRIFLVHLKDMDRQGDMQADVVPFGEGSLDLPGVFRELERQKFDGCLVIELEGKAAVDGAASLRKDLEYLAKAGLVLPAAE